MALVLASTFTSGMVAGNGLVGRAFAEKMPGVTAPFGLFVRRLAHKPARKPAPRHAHKPARKPAPRHASPRKPAENPCHTPAL